MKIRIALLLALGLTAAHAQSINVTTGGVGVDTETPRGSFDVAGQGGLVVSGTNLDPLNNYDLSGLQNSGSLLMGFNRSAGGGEFDFIGNRAGGNVGGFAFYDYSNTGTLTPVFTIKGNGDTTTPGTATVGALKVGTSTILSQGYFESSGYGLPGSGNTLTISHSLGGLPRFYSVSLRCVNSSFGWQAGDEIHLDSVHMRSGNYGCTVGVNASQFKLKQLGDVSIHRIDNNNIGVLDGNWQVVFRAWR